VSIREISEISYMKLVVGIYWNS